MEKYLRSKLRGGTFGQVPALRSSTMSQIRGKHNRTTEGRLRYALVRAAIGGWKLHVELPGRPDFYFDHEKVAIFVDGCFWHGCARCGHLPKTNRAFWKAKIERNKLRAKKWDRVLKRDRILVVHVWECELKSSLDAVVHRLERALRKRSTQRK